MHRLQKAFALIKQDVSDWFLSIVIALLAIMAMYIFLEACPFVLLTGFPCPGCGLTRAGLSVLQFRFIDAWHYNPCIYLIILVAGWLLIRRYLIQKPTRYLYVYVIVCTILIVGVYIFRLYYCFPSETPMIYYDKNVLASICKHIFNK